MTPARPNHPPPYPHCHYTPTQTYSTAVMSIHHHNPHVKTMNQNHLKNIVTLAYSTSIYSDVFTYHYHLNELLVLHARAEITSCEASALHKLPNCYKVGKKFNSRALWNSQSCGLLNTHEGRKLEFGNNGRCSHLSMEIALVLGKKNTLSILRGFVSLPASRTFGGRRGGGSRLTVLKWWVESKWWGM